MPSATLTPAARAPTANILPRRAYGPCAGQRRKALERKYGALGLEVRALAALSFLGFGALTFAVVEWHHHELARDADVHVFYWVVTEQTAPLQGRTEFFANFYLLLNTDIGREEAPLLLGLMPRLGRGLGAIIVFALATVMGLTVEALVAVYIVSIVGWFGIAFTLRGPIRRGLAAAG